MQTDNIENAEKYLLHSRGEIIQKLKMLAKDHCLITAHFNAGQESLITAVVDVLREKELIALDYGSNEAINKKLLGAERIVFKTQHHGITAQFSARSIIKAKLKGQPVFAVSIPEDLLWVQRREYYRIRIPLGVPIECHHTDESGETEIHKIIDISSGGIALADPEYDFDLEDAAGTILQNCRIVLPEFGEGLVALEIRNQLPLKFDDPGAGQRIGCSFVSIGSDFEANIQRYINHIETQRKQMESD